MWTIDACVDNECGPWMSVDNECGPLMSVHNECGPLMSVLIMSVDH